MKRFSSIDFLRGTAIVMMLFLHQISWFLNANAILANINNAPLIDILALVVLEFMGGLAGFFLLVSAIGNMISMYKRLQAGRSVNDLLLSQVVTGILLVIFAYLVEGDIGYLGALGDWFRDQTVDALRGKDADHDRQLVDRDEHASQARGRNLGDIHRRQGRGQPDGDAPEQSPRDEERENSGRCRAKRRDGKEERGQDQQALAAELVA